MFEFLKIGIKIAKIKYDQNFNQQCSPEQSSILGNDRYTCVDAIFDCLRHANDASAILERSRFELRIKTKQC